MEYVINAEVVSTILWWKLKRYWDQELSGYVRFNHPMVKVKVYNIWLFNCCKSCFNHPMVKVKAAWRKEKIIAFYVSTTLWWKLKINADVSFASKSRSFNHPMVKVKVFLSIFISVTCKSFNHPMVKVKGTSRMLLLRSTAVSTTLWWKLKTPGVHYTQADEDCFNHPMVKVKDNVEFVDTDVYEGSFNHPMVKVKVGYSYQIFYTYYGFNHPMVKVKGYEIEQNLY